ncbi:uncharacterized protein LOC101161707 [Oryzias latipes]|uniref:uncharacterized protein LOC101161707 n=1 Tax=Oryzias latipes TaxID=8090 RepID=UPI0002A4BB03|nr:uncharacterized protein LOC101161707 [Oryzias latipes]
MGRQDKEVDEESLQTRDRARARWMDVFLLVSVLILFLAVTALAVGEYVVVSEFGSRTARVSADSSLSKQTPDAPAAAFKMDNFAYVEPLHSVLENKTMTWHQFNYGKGTSVGSKFDFNKDDHSLRPLQAGAYFLYLEVNLTCTGKCHNLHLSLNVDDKLLCKVDLRKDQRSVSHKCWTVTQLDGKALLTQMRVSSIDVSHWKLEKKGSGLGMFLIG